MTKIGKSDIFKKFPRGPGMKDAKEFDREPLRNSEFYKSLPPTSGKPIQERWGGRRRSENVVDNTADPIAKIIEAEKRAMKQPDEMPQSGPAAEKKPRLKPKNTNPSSKSGRLNSQVTPGKWSTK